MTDLVVDLYVEEGVFEGAREPFTRSRQLLGKEQIRTLGLSEPNEQTAEDVESQKVVGMLAQSRAQGKLDVVYEVDQKVQDYYTDAELGEQNGAIKELEDVVQTWH